MYEDGHITDQEFKNAIIGGITLQFQKNSFPIKAPHFVQWIIERLEEEYGT